MTRRLLALLLIIWLFGLVWFSIRLPGAASISQKTDAIVVVTGGKGRIERGIDVLAKRTARRMLVSGVFPKVSKAELALVQNAPLSLFSCCIDLGKEAVDTRSNAKETAQWVKRNKFQSIRLVTNDWHMPRARFELERELGGGVAIVGDAVETTPSLLILFTEYHKLLARRLAAVFGY